MKARRKRRSGPCGIPRRSRLLTGMAGTSMVFEREVSSILGTRGNDFQTDLQTEPDDNANTIDYICGTGKADIGDRTAHVRFWPIADIGCCTARVRFRGQSGHDPSWYSTSRKLVQDHLTLKTERVAKIIRVATINPANTRIVRCSALGMVNWSAIASSTPGKI